MSVYIFVPGKIEIMIVRFTLLATAPEANRMSDEPRVGKLVFGGVDAVRMIESETPSDPSIPQSQRDAAKRIGDTIKAYLKAADQLLATKYQHLRDLTPTHLSQRGDVVVIVCADGVVIRYESPTPPRRLLAGLTNEGFAEVSLQASQHLVRCYKGEPPPPPEDSKAVTLRLSVVSPGTGQSRDLLVGSVTFNVQIPETFEAPIPPQKPFCLLSILNQLELELHVESEPVDNSTPSTSIVRSAIKLPVGWECLEVFAGLNLDHWKPAYAAVWAEADILGWVVARQHKEAQYNALDPRASVRRHFAILLAAFKALLDSDPEREQDLQSFLQANPALLCPTQTKMWPKLPLGAKVTDFVFRDAANNYLLVELERSVHRLFRQDGHPTAELTHATSQIVDWKRYLEDNLSTVQRELGLTGITTNPPSLVVIGRSASLSEQDRRKLQAMNGNTPTLQIATYDDVYVNAKAVCENLLGPIWETGGHTEIYHLSS